MKGKGSYKLIILFGLVSLISDFTYEGAKSIIGPYLFTLGASAVVVGFVSGISEFLGYFLRLVSGHIADKLKAYWFLTILGYAVNLFSVPLIGLTKNWKVVALLMSLERFGKAVRTPPRDVLLSFITQKVGHGKGFGLHEFMDQVGAILGPLYVALMLGFGYQLAFVSLFIPASLAMLLLAWIKRVYPEEEVERVSSKDGVKNVSLSGDFLQYLAASSIYALSFLPFPIVSYHLKASGFTDMSIPVLFSLAMFSDAVFALLFGYIFDKYGVKSVAFAPLLSSVASPVILYLSPILGLLIWGGSLGIQESIMRSAVASMVAESSRGRAYGIFYFSFGLFSFLGSLALGYLYSLEPAYMVLWSVLLGLISTSILVLLRV
ncbi:MFS transporter [Thermocrinis minervae]|uniref:Major Facilitator Superfamily protein n=1 Tax=Thermocrinis minervae TaxID=381751 RepID=A0A1M6QRM0_9AQUI|nr:MFS transporter [Thermocrinis minervae]SHK22959.1 Major Facilitator Superfamily protein [Thermocrinis minervae]